jgi:hypothetical protein
MPQKQAGKLAWSRPAERGNWNERPKHILLRYFWVGFQKYGVYLNSSMKSGNGYGGEGEGRGDNRVPPLWRHNLNQGSAFMAQ